jgi:Lon protease-like protein
MLLPLHIFEPRYRLLVKRCVEREEPFGVVLIRSGKEVGAHAEPRGVGTTARIVAATPLPDGRAFIVCQGERRFEIVALDAEQEPYLVGEVRYLDDVEGHHAAPLAETAAEAFGQYLMGILTATKEPSSEQATEDLGAGGPRAVAYRIAAALGIDADDRQRLLEAPTIADLLGMEIRLLERENVLIRDLLVRLRARGEGPPLN